MTVFFIQETSYAGYNITKQQITLKIQRFRLPIVPKAMIVTCCSKSDQYDSSKSVIKI